MTGDVIIIKKIRPLSKANHDQRLDLLQKILLKFSFFNLFLVACIGLLLRAFPFLSNFPLSFKNILHGHSHFAFGGWLMPVILALIIRYLPELTEKISYKHWRNLSFIFLFSAYGMLFTFPVTGYALFSVIFSTLSILGGFYLALNCWKAIAALPKKISLQFLGWALIYFVVSSIGPFTTGPLIVMGYKGEPIYFNAIYFYLHFQYNGWFAFIALAIFYRMLEGKPLIIHGKMVLLFLNLAIIPTFFLSILWVKPSVAFYIIGGIGAAIQLMSLFWLIKDIKQMQWKWKGMGKLFLIAMIAFCLKMVLQFFSAFPVIAEIAFTFRNFIISYLHMVLLGSISIFLIAAVLQSFAIHYTRQMKMGINLFLFSFITTETIMVLQAGMGWFGFVLPNYQQGLIIFSVLFPAGFLIMWKELGYQLNYRLSHS